MKVFIVFLLSIVILSCDNMDKKPLKAVVEVPEYAIVIHGGAGTIRRDLMTDEREKTYRDALETSLLQGEEVLKTGGTSLEAVRRAINYMEDSPLFNSGRGSVFTYNGTQEMDASIMDGATLNAGAVGGVSTIRNPINAALAVMEKSKHVFLVGKGAEEFADSNDIILVDPSYFLKDRDKLKKKEMGIYTSPHDYKYGTVGAVALDKDGNIAAGTSTGGMSNKRWNRIGDSPVIGAGTYANNKTAGISCTGHGEFFIRYAVAHDISALIEYKGMNAFEAGELVVQGKLLDAGAQGGVIILDKDGNISMPFNTPGMYRGYIKSTGEKEIKMYKE